jgi:myosin heavy subunit
MTIKEKVIRQSIKKIETRLKKLQEIQDANPAVDLIDMRKEASDFLKKNERSEQRSSSGFMKKIKEFSNREKQCWKMIERQKKWAEDSKEMAALTIEKEQLITELYYLDKRL